MILSRTKIEERENNILAEYAAKAKNSRGRKYNESEDKYRTCFQRDRDRIIHSKAFRRLKGKTQVFVAHFGDHYRSRLTHTMEVAQLSRDIARMLNLNEDLAETIALAHDLGHTPFGHAGQEAMDEMMQQYGDTFEHNKQSRRIVEYLEQKKPEHPGLNLTFEVTDGLIKHRTSFDSPEADDALMPSLEAQIANVADEIIYLNHDVDDGVRAGILKVEDLDKLSLWQKVKERIDPSLQKPFFVPAMVSEMMSLMTERLAEYSDDLISQSNISSLEQVYKVGHPLITFADDFQSKCKELKSFLYTNFYQSPGVADYNQKGQEIIGILFNKLMDNSKLLPEKIQSKLDKEEQHILVKDYVAGMTDQFALNLYNQLKT